jgi:hypothetical protein
VTRLYAGLVRSVQYSAVQNIFRVIEFYVTKLIIIFKASLPTQPSVKSHQWDSSHRLRNTSVALIVCTLNIGHYNE